jgi:hypothetical protein
VAALAVEQPAAALPVAALAVEQPAAVLPVAALVPLAAQAPAGLAAARLALRAVQPAVARPLVLPPAAAQEQPVAPARLARVAAERRVRAPEERPVRRPAQAPGRLRPALPAEADPARAVEGQRVAALPAVGAVPPAAAAACGHRSWRRAMRFCAAWRRCVRRPKWHSASRRA